MRKPLLKYTYCRVYNKDDAEDIVQDALLILHSKMNENNPNKSFYNWALAICKFQILKYLTIHKRNKIYLIEDLEVTSDSLSYCCNNDPFNNFCNIEKIPIWTEINPFLNNTEKKVFNLCLSGSSPKEIMFELKLTQSHYSVSKARALKKAKKLLKDKSIQNYKL